MSDKTPLSEQLRVIFQELRTHYQNTYEDVAVRMGNMLLLLNEFYVSYMISVCTMPDVRIIKRLFRVFADTRRSIMYADS